MVLNLISKHVLIKTPKTILITPLGRESKSLQNIEKSIERFHTIHGKKQKTFYFFVMHQHTVKHAIILCIPKLLQKNFYFFSFQYIRMSGKSITFDDKKIKRVNFIKTKK